ncbi:MAG: carboxypeptidase-like regulatory domain-containing protein [Planctomycetota bacterium]
MNRILLAVLLLGAAAAVLFLFRPVTDDAVVPLPDPVRFRVFDVEGKPAAGVRVERWLRVDWKVEARMLQEVVAGEDGEVRLPEPDPTPGLTEVYIARPATGAPAVGVDGELEDGLHSPVGRKTTGRVLDLRGRPIAGARVMTPPLPPYAAETTTDESGRYDLGEIADDAWIRAKAPGHAVLDLPLAFYPDEGDVVFLLAPGFTISGRVVDGEGNPVAGGVIELEQESTTRQAIPAGGTFTFTSVLPNWEAVFTVRVPGLVSPPVTALCGEKDVVVRALRPASIEAAVVDGETGEPLRDYEVRREGAIRTEAGTFRLESLAPGTVEIRVDAGTRRGKVEVTVVAGQHIGDVTVPVFLPWWGEGEDFGEDHAVTIRARDDAGPVKGALVRLDGTSKIGRTDATGTFGVRMSPGRHRFLVGGLLDSHGLREVDVTVEGQVETIVDLEPNPETVLSVHVERETGDRLVFLRAGGESRLERMPDDTFTFPVAEGTVFDLYVQMPGYLVVYRPGIERPEDGLIVVQPERGTYVAGTCVGEGDVLLPKVVAELTSLPPEMRDETLGDGKFRIGPIDPGPYELQLTGRNIRTWRKEIVVPTEGNDVGIVCLQAPCDLHIRVTAGGGVPVRGAEVRTTYRVEARGVTDGAGYLLLPGTEPSEMLRVRAPGYLDTWEEIRLAEDSWRQELNVRLFRPARIVVRAVDSEGRPVHLLEPGDTDLEVLMLRSDQLLLRDVPPGPVTLPLADRAGRTGELAIDVAEGEERTVTVTLRRP